MAESVPAARDATVEYARGLGAGEPVARAVALAVTEACSNVVLHAYREGEEPGAMTVLVEHPGDSLYVTVLDDGHGIVPRGDSPGLGLGLPLIHRLTDGLELRSRSEGGSEVRMRFDLAHRPDAAR
jgi:anti-sigma regulatory factor (Ser/Thr protein kinase)